MAVQPKNVEGLEALKNYHYRITAVGLQADEYTKTTRAIAEYSARVYGHEMKQLVLLGKEATPVAPKYPESGSEGEKAVWSKMYDQYLRKTEKYVDYKAKVFAVIWGQCDQTMKNRLESTAEYKKAEDTNDVVQLLRAIKDVAFDADDKKYPPLQAVVAWTNLVRAWQRDGEDLNDYYNRCASLVELVERTYGPIAPVKVAEKDPTYSSDQSAALERERSKMMACIFMQGANYKKYGGVMRQLKQDFVLGDQKYPESMEQAVQVLRLCEAKGPNKPKINKVSEGLTEAEESGLAAAQVPRRAKFKKGRCYNCGKIGHMAPDCPDKKDKEEQKEQHHVQFPDEPEITEDSVFDFQC
jgi:hypothetical protein